MSLFSGIGFAHFGGIVIRHHDRLNCVCAERIHCNRQYQRRVDATGQAEDNLAETILEHVIAGCQYQCRVELL